MPEENHVRPYRFFMVVGDSSGDMHASNLIKQIKNFLPDAKFYGYGGKLMQEAGCKLYFNMVDKLSVMFSNVFSHLSKFISLYRKALKVLDNPRTRPDVVILIDFPGFNLYLAKALRKRTIPVVYYISPQVWAWAPWRLRKIAKRVDKMLCILPFEEELYDKKNVLVEYVGHPLFDNLAKVELNQSFRSDCGFSSDDKVVGLLPGSRIHEIEKTLPIMLDACRLLYKKHPEVKLVIPVGKKIYKPIIEVICNQFDIPVTIVNGNVFEVMKYSDLVIVKCGTTTLEVMHFLTPMIVIYPMNWLSWVLAKIFKRVKYIVIMNILAGKMVVPEYLLSRNQYEVVTKEAKRILFKEGVRESMLEEMKQIRDTIDSQGASAKAASEIVEVARKSRIAGPQKRKHARKTKFVIEEEMF